MCPIWSHPVRATVPGSSPQHIHGLGCGLPFQVVLVFYICTVCTLLSVFRWTPDYYMRATTTHPAASQHYRGVPKGKRSSTLEEHIHVVALNSPAIIVLHDLLCAMRMCLRTWKLYAHHWINIRLRGFYPRGICWLK